MTTESGASKVLPRLPRFEGVVVPLTETLATPMNLVITAGLVVLVPLVLWMLAPRGELSAPYRAAAGGGAPEAERSGGRDAAADRESFAERLDRSPWMAGAAVLAIIAALAAYARGKGLWNIGLNEVNLAMLGLGLALHGSIRSYVAAVEKAMAGCAGILLQFPLYAGIMGIMVASGLAEWIAKGIGDAATAETLPLYTFAAAAVLNLFVPSGGGQWAVQGPIALESAARLGVEPGKVIMAVAYGTSSRTCFSRSGRCHCSRSPGPRRGRSWGTPPW